MTLPSVLGPWDAIKPIKTEGREGAFPMGGGEGASHGLREERVSSC
jgi:hypothetical protein